MRGIFVKEKPRYGRRIAIAAGVIAGIAALIAAGYYLVGLLPEDVVPIAVDESARPVPESDQSTLSHIVFDPELPRLAVPASFAVEAATKENDPVELGASRVDAYLATITVPSSVDASSPIVDRDVWIIKLSGMSVARPGSSDAPDSATLSTAYVLVDASTGEVMYTEWHP